ncbi:MAG: DUF2975 domain-containing protein [Chitinophagaceae bacterium]
MNENDLRKVKWLVIFLKTLIICSFVLSAFENRDDFVAGFKAGVSGEKNVDGYSYVSVIPDKDTLLRAGANHDIVGISQLIIKEKDNVPNAKTGFEWNTFAEGLGEIVFFISSIILIIQIFKLLNRLQRLQILDKYNIVILKKIVCYIVAAGIGYNIYANSLFYNRGKDIHIAGYQVELFSWENIDFNFVMFAVAVAIIATIWNYAIDLKTENELTV